MKTIPIVTEALADIGDALKKFGTYQFDDKGPNEVMDMDHLLVGLMNLPVAEAAEAIHAIAKSKKHGGRGLQLASALVVDLQGYEELWEEDSDIGAYL